MTRCRKYYVRSSTFRRTNGQPAHSVTEQRGCDKKNTIPEPAKLSSTQQNNTSTAQRSGANFPRELSRTSRRKLHKEASQQPQPPPPSPPQQLDVYSRQHPPTPSSRTNAAHYTRHLDSYVFPRQAFSVRDTQQVCAATHLFEGRSCAASELATRSQGSPVLSGGVRRRHGSSGSKWKTAD